MQWTLLYEDYAWLSKRLMGHGVNAAAAQVNEQVGEIHLVQLAISTTLPRMTNALNSFHIYLKKPACRSARWTARYTPSNPGSSASWAVSRTCQSVL